MRTFLLLLVLVLPMLIAAQTKKPKAVSLDVDRLYAKYKDYETITIHTASGDVTANVKIMYNDAGKPYSVILYGYAILKEQTLREIMENLIAAKEKAGYKYVNYDLVFFDIESVSTEVYQKKTQYAKYGIKTSDDRNRLANEEENRILRQGGEYHDEYKPKKNPLADFFYFEVGDFSRRSSGKQERFTF
ncbi:MAG: hypothetical protein ACXVBP_07615 [Flavisolibacter sp.]